jgi:hypothetical protein
MHITNIAKHNYVLEITNDQKTKNQSGRKSYFF